MDGYTNLAGRPASETSYAGNYKLHVIYTDSSTGTNYTSETFTVERHQQWVIANPGGYTTNYTGPPNQDPQSRYVYTWGALFAEDSGGPLEGKYIGASVLDTDGSGISQHDKCKYGL